MKQARVRIAIGLTTVGALMAALAWYNARAIAHPDGWVPVNTALKQALATIETPASPEPIASNPPETQPPQAQPQAPDQPADSRLNLNEATIAQLEQLPGIGPSKAKAIAAYRDQHGGFRKVEELLNVKGIGPKIFEKLSPEVYVR